MSPRPGCGSNAAGTLVDNNGSAIGANNYNPTVGGLPLTGVPCAPAGQATTSFHTPMLADDQYLAWAYDRQMEKDWTEVFLNFGNDTVVGTVGLQGFGFTDAEYNHNYPAQFGISQGYVTVTPDLTKLLPRLKTEIKVGAFWGKYGMAGQYDAGQYDTYLFGRLHQMGEAIKLEYPVGDFRFRLEDGVGTKGEQIAVGNPIQPAPMVATSGSVSAEGMPGFSLVHHAHIGFSFKDVLDVNAHYIASWSQDARIATTTNDGIGGGSMTVTGAEAHVWGGIAGNLYVGYSFINAQQAEYVGPVVEVVHSMGGGGYPNSTQFFDQGYGIVDNFLGTCGGGSSTAACSDPTHQQGTGSIHTLEVQYDYSFGLLYRKLKSGQGFWGDGSDLTLSLFGMYNAINTFDSTMPTQKLKVGAEVIYTPLKWLGVGVRVDDVNQNLTNDGATANQDAQFTSVGPKLIFRSKFITHETITAQWVHYTYWANVLPQNPYNGGSPMSGFPVYRPDENAFGLKATMWW
jgi:hypothetical protein